jgi:hypothetical protein
MEPGLQMRERVAMRSGAERLHIPMVSASFMIRFFVCLLSVNLDMGSDEEDAALHHFSADI